MSNVKGKKKQKRNTANYVFHILRKYVPYTIIFDDAQVLIALYFILLYSLFFSFSPSFFILCYVVLVMTFFIDDAFEGTVDGGIPENPQ